MKVLLAVVSGIALLGTGCGTRDHRSERLRQLERARAGIPPHSVLFVGSSTIERFPLAALFPAKGAVNLGVADEDSALLLERLPRTLPVEEPAGIVLYAGSADLRFDPALPAARIRDRVASVLDALAARFPEAPVAMVEVLPARAQTPAEKDALRELNRELKALAAARKADWIPTSRDPILDGNGDLAAAFSMDRHHLNLAGYEHLARWILEDGGDAAATLR
jgi:lysophospholipase L1-like esterase